MCWLFAPRPRSPWGIVSAPHDAVVAASLVVGVDVTLDGRVLAHKCNLIAEYLEGALLSELVAVLGAIAPPRRGLLVILVVQSPVAIRRDNHFAEFQLVVLSLFLRRNMLVAPAVIASISGCPEAGQLSLPRLDLHVCHNDSWIGCSRPGPGAPGSGQWLEFAAVEPVVVALGDGHGLPKLVLRAPVLLPRFVARFDVDDVAAGHRDLDLSAAGLVLVQKRNLLDFSVHNRFDWFVAPIPGVVPG